MKIAVLGAGGWGTALAILLRTNNHYVTLWSYESCYAEEINQHHKNSSFLPGVKIPDDIIATVDIQSAIEKKDVLIFAVPSQFIRSVAEKINSTNLSNIIIVNVAKGIEKHTMKTMSKVLIEVLPTASENNIATLSGPSHAEEVGKNIPTAVVAASKNMNVARTVQQLFMNPSFRVYTNNDILGVELGGSLKNVIAVAAGIIDGAGYGDNTKAALMTRGMAEISRLGIAMGANPHTFAGLSGIGDLFVTCMSHHSRNRYVGEQIGKGRKLKEVLDEMVMVAEGVDTTRSTVELSKKYNVELPIVLEVYRMLFEDKNPHVSMEELMTRTAKEELVLPIFEW